MSKLRTYYGVPIHPETTRNSWGLRYWAFGPGRLLRSDTLEGMRSLIRKDRTRMGLTVRNPTTRKATP